MKIKCIMIAALIALSTSLLADYPKALELFSQGKYAETLKLIGAELDAAQDMNPSSPNYNLRFLAGHCHWKLKNYDGALSHLARCAQIKPTATEPLIDIALIYLDMKHWQDALNIGQKIVALDKKNAMGFYILGKARYGFENFWGAKEYLEKATSLDFELYPAWNELGKSLLLLKKYPEAETALSTAYSLNPKSSEVMNNLAVAYLRNGKKDKAVEMIKGAATADPSNAEIQKNARLIAGN